MREYRKIISVHPVIMYREDLLELEILLKSNLSLEEDDLNIEIGADDSRMLGNSFESLFTQKLPDRTNELSIRVYGRPNGIQIDKHISFTFYHNYINYQISSTNENWFLGMISQLNRFFIKRKPWYSFLNSALPFLSGGLIGISFLIIPIAAAASLATKNFSFLVSSSSIFLLGIVMTYLNFKEILFPYVRIYTISKHKAGINYERLNLIVAIMTLLITIVGIVLPFILR